MRPFRAAAAVLAALPAVLPLGGCLSPRGAAKDADESAYRIIREKQTTSLGRNEPFDLGRPEDLLRRKLLLDQALPAAGAASFGKAYLPPVPKQPRGVTGDQPLPAEAVVAPVIYARVEGENTLDLSTDLFLNQIGKNPSGGYVAPDPALLSPPSLGPPAPDAALKRVLVINLLDALEIGARNSREYQRQKEQVFVAALNLDLQRDFFEFRFSGTLDAAVTSELEGDDTAGVSVSPAFGVSKLFKSGALLTARIGVDLARLLTGDKGSSLGVFGDATISIPLLRGAGVEVVAEPLQQSERDMVYAIWQFERFKRTFAVDVASQFLNTLGDLDSVTNSTENYRLLVKSTQRAAALFGEGRLPGIQVDQSTQQTLRARDRLLFAQQRYEQRLDSFKVQLGLPPDARVVLDKRELERLTPLADRLLGPAEGRDERMREGFGLAFGPAAPATQPAKTNPAAPVQGLEDLRDPAAAATRPAESGERPRVEPTPADAPPRDGTTAVGGTEGQVDGDTAPRGEPAGVTLAPTRPATLPGGDVIEDSGPTTGPAPAVLQDLTTRPTTRPAGIEPSPLVEPAVVEPGHAQTTRPALPDPAKQLDPLRVPDNPEIDNPTSLPAPVDPNNLPAGVSEDLPAQQLVGEPANLQTQQAAIRLALQRRLDLATVYGQVNDAQRQTVVFANALETTLNLTGGAAYGGRRGSLDGDLPNANLRLAEGTYNAGLAVDLPIERTAERNDFRVSLIVLDRAIRAAQEAEDNVKLDVLNDLRNLRVTAEDLRIQAVSINVAERRGAAATLLIALGRGQIRDQTEAFDALITAQNGYTSALINYRVGELALQRDLGILEIDENGLYRETSQVLPLLEGSN